MSESIIDEGILTNAIIALASTFKQAGCNPPIKIEVDQSTFDKILAESVKLYDIDAKKAITSREFSLSGIITITEQSKEEPTVTKYKCSDCEAVFDSKISHRKHYQAFHYGIKDPIETREPAI
jgi:hypothetical protein